MCSIISRRDIVHLVLSYEFLYSPFCMIDTQQLPELLVAIDDRSRSNRGGSRARDRRRPDPGSRNRFLFEGVRCSIDPWLRVPTDREIVFSLDRADARKRRKKKIIIIIRKQRETYSSVSDRRLASSFRWRVPRVHKRKNSPFKGSDTFGLGKLLGRQLIT